MPAPVPVTQCACSEALKLSLAAHLLRCAHDVSVCKGKPGRVNVEIMEGAA